MSGLRSKMIRAMELRDFSPRTHESYLAAVAGLVKFHRKSPDLLTHQDVEDYLLHLKVMGKSSSTRNVVTAGLRFFYEQTLENMVITIKLPKRKKPRILPEVLGRGEVARVLDAPRNLKHRVILMTAYSAGLRVSEIANLKINHIDSEQMVIRVEQGKGQKDRHTLLSKRLLDDDYRARYKMPPAHLKVAGDILNCRTAYLGGHVERCNECGAERISCNSCRNRHCPKCQCLTETISAGDDA